MKKQLMFVLFVLSGFAVAGVATAQSSGKCLHLVYIDNSSRGSANGGLSKSVLDYIFTSVLDTAQVSERKGSCYLFISNGENPYYSNNPSKFRDYLNRAIERKLRYPSSLDDKKTLRQMLYGDKLSGFSSVVIDLYVTDYYLTQDLLGENSGYLLNYFPKELQYVTHCADGNVTVNVIYPAGGQGDHDFESKFKLTGSVAFASNIKYNFIGK